jgi:hypothetical protein
MPLIKPRTRGKQMVRLITRLDRENNEALYAYAQFLGEPIEYVLNQLVDTVLAKDKDFVVWRADHRQSCVPRPGSRRRGARSASATPHLGAATSLSEGSVTGPSATERV